MGKPQLLRLNHNRHLAVGYYIGSAFCVVKGSMIEYPESLKPCMYPENREIHRHILDDGIAVFSMEPPEGLLLTRDYHFTSPGQAANVLLGTHGKGPKHWTEWLGYHPHILRMAGDAYA